MFFFKSPKMNVNLNIPRSIRAPVALLGLICLAACGYDDIATTAEIDPSGHMSREDYQALRERDQQAPLLPEAGFPPIPETSAGLTPPPAPPPEGSDRLVSVTVTDSVPLRDVL